MISLRNWELPKWEPENWARNTENFKNWEDIFTESFLVDDSKSSKTQNLQMWEILKLRIHKLGMTRLWELWKTLHSNCEKNKTEKPKTTILSHQECNLWDQNFKWETVFEQLYKDSKWQFTFLGGTFNATLNLQILLIWSYIKISTKKKTHLAALNVPLNSWLLLIWRYMKIRTRVKNHSAALNVPLL